MFESEWRVLREGPAGGPWNMAVDEAIARAVGEGLAPATLRFYSWRAPSVSLGYLQRTPGGVDLEVCRQRAIGLVRRITGGRAVLHAGEITYSVAVPLCGPWRSHSVVEAFRLISHGLIAGLLRLGVRAHLGEAGGQSGDGVETGACFLLRGLPAILVDGRKLVGSAQRRWDRSLLQHGSLLLDYDPRLHRAVFPAWPRTDCASGVTSLRELLGASVTVADVVSGLSAGWGQACGVPCVPGALTPFEQSVADYLVRSRYATAAWTFRR